jgi:hypothetical protein
LHPIIILEYSHFQFYVKGQLLDGSLCDLNHFSDKSNFLGSIEFLELKKSVKYSTKTCPYGFLNTALQRLFLDQITNSLIYKNRLEFTEIKHPDAFSLNNLKLNYLILSCTYENITTKLLNKFVFKYLTQLYLTGIISGIETDLFLNFHHLKKLVISTQNMKRLLSQTNKWIKNLNPLININLNDTKDFYKNMPSAFFVKIIEVDPLAGSTLIIPNVYLYPDEDFCLFRHFPHEHLVFTAIYSTERLECSCTIMWLLRYTFVFFNEHYTDHVAYDYERSDGLKGNITVNHCRDDFVSKLRACRFQERINMCDMGNFSTRTESKRFLEFNNDADLLFLVKWLELVIFVFLQPIFCALSLASNLTTVVVTNICLSKEKSSSKNMYKHIRVNSILIIIYCSLSILKLINVCVFDLSPFCSSVYQEKASQYFYLCFILFLGNAVRLSCHFSFISFSLSRILMTGYKNSTIYKRFMGFNLLAYYGSFITLSLGLSLFKLFEYQINEIYFSTKTFPFEKYDIGNCDKNDLNCSLFRILNMVNDFLKNVAFIFVNLVIDIVLFKNSKDNVELKKKLNIDSSKIEKAVHLKNKLNRMIFINGVLFSVAYLPEFLVYILLNVFDKKIRLFCFSYMSCREFTEFAQIFNYLSLFLQFFVLKKFNRSFEENFIYFKNKFKNKKLKFDPDSKKE